MDSNLDAHSRPPDQLRQRYKVYQKMQRAAIDTDTHIFDASRTRYAGCHESQLQLPEDIRLVLARFLQTDGLSHDLEPLSYEHPHLPGLIIVPSLLPPDVQTLLLDKLLHRDLSNPAHQTNLHTHYNVSYPPLQASSFFGEDALKLVQQPKDPCVHKALSMESCLNRKLRWTTLGGQYDWTQKAYPSSPPPKFPSDVADLVEGLFPAMKAQAAIVNLYTPGDTLSLHRDVSEECDRPLVSISLGCDGLFIAGLETLDETGQVCATSVTVRLRSGDAVLMSGPARYAWHGVPQVLSGTCPEWMSDWPCKDGEYAHWKGWMAKKRVNLNVRQMWDVSP